MSKQRSNNSVSPHDIVKVDDIAQIMERGVMMLPAIIVDGDLKISGRVADVPEIKKFLAGGA